MKKLLLLVAFLVLLIPVYADPILDITYPARVYEGEGFTIAITVSDSEGDLQNIQIIREGILQTTYLCMDEYFCIFNWQTSEPYDGIFEYEVTVDSGEANEIFTIEVLDIPGPDNPPVAVDDSYSTDEDTVLIAITSEGVLSNDSDPDGDTIKAELSAGVSYGSLILNDDGSFIYTPNDDFNGEDSFTYRAFDGDNYSDIATVTITVNPINDAPIANDDAYSVDEDSTLTVSIPGVLANDIDVDGDTLFASVITDVNNGILSLNSDGSFDYTPDPNFTGEDTFTYQAHDSTINSNIATVKITVNPTNDAPVAVDDSYYVLQDTTLIVPTSGVLANDYDPDGDALTTNLVNSVGYGTLTLNSDGSFTYIPNTGFTGTDSFTYQAYDGADYSNTATVTIEVTLTQINNPPTAVDDSYSVDQDTTLTISALGVLSNDFDVDGDTITAILDSNALNGNVELNSDGSFVYTPNTGFVGTDGFTYIANDGTDNSNVATVAITVNPVTPINQPPIANAGSDKTCYINKVCTLSGSGSDVDGNIISFSWTQISGTIITLTNSNNALTSFTPTQIGTYVFRLTVTDDDGDQSTDTVTITVTSTSVIIPKKPGQYVSTSGGRSSSYISGIPTISIPDRTTEPKLGKAIGSLVIFEPSVKLERGQTETVEIIVRNTGERAATFDLSINDLQEANYEFQPATVVIYPNQELKVFAHISAFDDARLGKQVATITLNSGSKILTAQALIIDIQPAINYETILAGLVLVGVALVAIFLVGFRHLEFSRK